MKAGVALVLKGAPLPLVVQMLTKLELAAGMSLDLSAGGSQVGEGVVDPVIGS